MNTLPRTAWLLGYGGVLPFLILTLMLWLDKSLPLGTLVNTTGWLLSYAAIILSFVGAVSWGVALGMDTRLRQREEANELLIYSVMPALLAWATLLLPSASWALWSMSLLMVLAYFADQRLIFPRVNADYARLRLHLTAAVALLLFLAGFGV